MERGRVLREQHPGLGQKAKAVSVCLGTSVSQPLLSRHGCGLPHGCVLPGKAYCLHFCSVSMGA